MTGVQTCALPIFDDFQPAGVVLLLPCLLVKALPVQRDAVFKYGLFALAAFQNPVEIVLGYPALRHILIYPAYISF